MTSVYSFPTPSNLPDQESSVYNHFDLYDQAQISLGVVLIEVPDFKIDQKLFGNFIVELEIDFLKVEQSLIFSYLSIKGDSLFDVRKLFISFFYPW